MLNKCKFKALKGGTECTENADTVYGFCLKHAKTAQGIKAKKDYENASNLIKLETEQKMREQLIAEKALLEAEKEKLLREKLTRDSQLASVKKSKVPKKIVQKINKVEEVENDNEGEVDDNEVEDDEEEDNDNEVEDDEEEDNDNEVEEAKSSKKINEKKITKILSQVKQKKKKVIKLKPNAWGRYEDISTGFVFDQKTKKVYGRQLLSGKVAPLTRDDKRLCRDKGYGYNSD